LPLNITTVPRPLRRVAVSIAIYWLSERDNQITDLIQKRYDSAVQTLKEMANGTRDLGLPTDTPAPETDNGRMIVVSITNACSPATTSKGCCDGDFG
jgi:phage gp36-like protein